MFELKLMVVYILHNFFFESVDELDNVKISTDIILFLSTLFCVKLIHIYKIDIFPQYLFDYN